MALSRIWSSDSSVFNTMTAKAITMCVWTLLLRPAYHLELIMNFVEFSLLVSWGLTCNFVLWSWDDQQVQAGNPPLFAPFSLSVIMAGVIRDVVNMLWWLSMYVFKWAVQPN